MNWHAYEMDLNIGPSESTFCASLWGLIAGTSLSFFVEGLDFW